MQVITRDWVSKHFTLTDDNGIHDYHEFSCLVDKWKYILVTKYNAKKGLTFGFTTCVIDIRYFSLFFACLELGLKLVVYNRPYTNKDLLNYKLTVFKPIDLMVYNTEILNEVTQTFISKFATTAFSLDELEIDITLHQLDYEPVLPSDILLLTTSSGTTEQPKVIKHTHQFFYELCLRNANVIPITENDNILHIRNMHHGSSVGVFFLPTLRKCKNHFCVNFSDDNVEPLVSQITKYNITKLLVPYNKVMNLLAEVIIKNNVKFYNLTIFNLSYLEPKWVKLCNDSYVKEIISMFGCNETSGPIFLPYINNTTLLGFDNTNLGDIIDDFYNVDIINNSLHVYLSTYNTWVNTEDLFEKIHTNYIFLGKNRLVRINDVEFSIIEISDVVRKYVNVEHVVVLDQNNLYLAIFEEEDIDLSEVNNLIANTLSPLIVISKYAKLNYMDYLYGIKLDHYKIRKYFRDNCD